MLARIRELLSRARQPGPVFCTVYATADAFIIPTNARTEAGFYVETEPVEVVKHGDAAALAAALERAAGRGNPPVSTPPPDGFPPPVVMAYANHRNAAEFARTARMWWITADGARATLIPCRNGPRRAFLPLESERVEIETGRPLLAVAERISASAA